LIGKVHYQHCGFECLDAEVGWRGAHCPLQRLSFSKERNHGKRRDHQELEIVDVGNDLRLPRDHGNTGLIRTQRTTPLEEERDAPTQGRRATIPPLRRSALRGPRNEARE
jgi:hypothetical protein